MDKKLEAYFNNTGDIPPPFIDLRMIQQQLEKRTQRRLLVAASFAALLWMTLLCMTSALVFKANQFVALVIAAVVGVGVMCSGVFSVFVLKFKKAGM